MTSTQEQPDQDFGGYTGSHGPSIVGVGFLVLIVWIFAQSRATLRNPRAGTVERYSAGENLKILWIVAILGAAGFLVSLLFR